MSTVVTLRISPDLLAEIDAAAKVAGLNLSTFMLNQVVAALPGAHPRLTSVVQHPTSGKVMVSFVDLPLPAADEDVRRIFTETKNA